MAEGKDPSYRWKVLGIVMLGTLMGALDQSIVNVSLPAIMADFGSSLDDIEWVITGYMLSFATLMPLTAWFKDIVGHRILFAVSLAVFTAGSVLCGLAWNLPTLVLARVIQAFGGGAITPTGMAMISEEFPPHERAKALGYWGMGVIVGPAFGPTLGGILTNAFGWRSIFLVNLPIGIIGVILAFAVLYKDKPGAEHRRPFDIWGFAFLSLFLVASLLGLSKGEKEGWDSAYIFACGTLAVLGFSGFLVVESILPYRIVDINLFRIPVFSACMAVTVVRSIALFGGVFLLPIYLQQLRGLDEIDSGVLLLWGSLLIGVMMPISPKLMDRFGAKAVTIMGLIWVAAFMFMLRGIDVNTSIGDIIIATLVRGVGIGLVFTPVTAVALNSVPKRSAGAASSVMNLIQQVGGSVGIAMLATVLSHRVKFHMAVFGSQISPSSPMFRETFRRVAEHAHLLGYTHAESARIAYRTIGMQVATSAEIAGFGDSFIFGTMIVLAGISAALFLPARVAKLSQEERLAAME
ncbi:MAG TPA: DHA2 family efflux MFS transporter permease subunit [Bdellovibrionota bacterium]|jgi:DHA2 family multidrug resistance protein|nr:DHA2 family efflux MFS transporter permease subunit [Bdellovibrionota bacterium]